MTIVAADDVVILVSSTAVWRVRLNPAAGEAQVAEAVADALADGAGGEVVVAVPSTWCLAAQVEMSAAGARDDHKSLLFRLEEKLPLAAEEVVADFIVQADAQRPRALGIAARLGQVRALVAAIEAAGAGVRSVTPLVLLAAQHARGDHEKRDAIDLWPEDEQVNILAFRGGRLGAWSLVPDGDEVAVQREVDVQSLSYDQPPTVVRRDQIEGAAAACARAFLAGRQSPWVELRRGALASADPIRSHRLPLNFALAAAAAFLVLLAGGMIVRAARYDRLAASYGRQLAGEFGRAFPGWSPPANVHAVIDSEHRKAQAQRSDAASGVAQASALRMLHEVLSRFPAQGRCDVDRLTFGDGSFELQGRVAALEDVEPLATAAREAGLEVPPPLTRRGADGAWTVTLRGARPQAAAAAAAGVAMAGGQP